MTPKPPQPSDVAIRPMLPAELNAMLPLIESHLETHRELGLLSIGLLRRQPASGERAWSDYDAIQREISLFLARFSVRGLRRTDTVLEPAVSGNTFVILVGPPRQRALAAPDLDRVRKRLRRALDGHLESALPRVALERFDIFLGAAQMRFEPEVACSRVIYRCLEEAVAEATRLRRQETTRQSARLARILRKGHIRAVYQPLIDLSARGVIGFEALSRVASGPAVPPDQLMRAAHDNGVLWELERLCRHRAVTSLPALRSNQLLFLNVEHESFRDPELLGSRFMEQIRAAGLEPERVVLELTEHSSIEDFRGLRQVLRPVRDRGFRLALDDVGSGYAGLQSIAEIEPDYIKIDMSLVRNLHLRPVKRELIASFRRFTENTGTVLVAEGVESGEELDSLTRLGVRVAQGYLFARPEASPPALDWDRLSRCDAPSC